MKRVVVKDLMKSVCLSVALAVAAPMYAHAADKPATTSTDMQVLKDKLKADKKKVIAANMSLTDAEAKAFWPIYDAYQQDLGAMNKRIGALVKSYSEAYNSGVFPEELASSLTNESIAVDAAEVQMRKDYAAKLFKVLPTWKAARYMQIENKIRALVKYELAANVPVID